MTTDVLKRNDLSRFPKLDPQLAAEASDRYLKARENVIASATIRCACAIAHDSPKFTGKDGQCDQKAVRLVGDVPMCALCADAAEHRQNGGGR